MPEPVNFHFRTALHGFHREDVVRYIDQITQANENDKQRLMDANARLYQELEQAGAAAQKLQQMRGLETELGAARQKMADLTEENNTLRSRCAELEAEVEEAKKAAKAAAEQPLQAVGEAAAPVSDSVPVPQDLSAPIPPVQEITPTEQAPSKDYTEMELAAYRRAEMAERLARERAADVYRQVQSVFTHATAKMDTGKSDLEQLTQTIQEDVNQMMLLLSNIRSAYDEAELSFGEVSQRNRELLENNN